MPESFPLPPRIVRRLGTELRGSYEAFGGALVRYLVLQGEAGIAAHRGLDGEYERKRVEAEAVWKEVLSLEALFRVDMVVVASEKFKVPLPDPEWEA